MNKLVVKKVLDIEFNSVKKYFYIKGTCNELDSFVKSGHYENYLPIIEEFMKYVDVVIQNKK